jgi:hypothetical protein
VAENEYCRKIALGIKRRLALYLHTVGIGRQTAIILAPFQQERVSLSGASVNLSLS